MAQKHQLNLDDIRHIAHLARLSLTEEQLTQYAETLTSILQYFETLDRLDTTQVEPTAHALPTFDVLREDEVKETMDPDDVVMHAPDAQDNFFRVPKVLDQE
ncbi:MAG: Asp-tRNA(Asn)/Glu-tRNA(Gln) amidotransferase subunit GatC [Phycisphaerae bacterium]